MGSDFTSIYFCLQIIFTKRNFKTAVIPMPNNITEILNEAVKLYFQAILKPYIRLTKSYLARYRRNSFRLLCRNMKISL